MTSSAAVGGRSPPSGSPGCGLNRTHLPGAPPAPPPSQSAGVAGRSATDLGQRDWTYRPGHTDHGAGRSARDIPTEPDRPTDRPATDRATDQRPTDRPTDHGAGRSARDIPTETDRPTDQHRLTDRPTDRTTDRPDTALPDPLPGHGVARSPINIQQQSS